MISSAMYNRNILDGERVADTFLLGPDISKYGDSQF